MTSIIMTRSTATVVTPLATVFCSTVTTVVDLIVAESEPEPEPEPEPDSEPDGEAEPDGKQNLNLERNQQLQE